MASGVQVHDFNPGISPAGVFWTIAMPSSAVQVNLKNQTASFAYDSLAIPDFHDFANSLLGTTPPMPGFATFDVEWSGTTSQTTVRNAAETYEGTYLQDTATITFTVAWATPYNFTFTSDPASTATSLFAEIGVERNGVFFR